MPIDTLKKAANFIETKRLFTKSEKILCAISGGKDSVAMSLMLNELGFTIALAHVNFQLRENESDEDETFVKAFANKLGVPFFGTRFNTKSLLKKGESTQMCARRLRYNWFKSITEKEGFDKIATAHSANDNAETLIYNLSKGAGLASMVGIPFKNGNIVRPILSLSSKEVLHYLKAKEQIFRADKSNESDYYSRNKIRHHVIPVLKEINGSLENTITDYSKRFNRINTFYQASILALKKEFWLPEDFYWKLDINIGLKHFTSLNKTAANGLFLNFVLECLLPLGFSEAAIESILTANTGAEVLSAKYRIIKNRNELLLAQKDDIKPKSEKVNWAENKKGLISNNFGTLYWEGINSKEINKQELVKPEFAFVNTSLLQKELVLKPIDMAQKFKPFGMKGSMLLSDYMINNKWNVLQKDAALVLESNKNPVWLVNHRIADEFRIGPNTKEVLKLSWLKKNNTPFPFT